MSDDGRKLFRYTDDEILAMAAGSDDDPLLTAALLEILALRKEINDIGKRYDELRDAFIHARPRLASRYTRLQGTHGQKVPIHEETAKS